MIEGNYQRSDLRDAPYCSPPTNSTNSIKFVNSPLVPWISMAYHVAIQSEFYKEFLAEKSKGRDVESDAEGADLPGEKIYNVEGEVV